MTNSLTGKTALVTGATAGIGYAVAVKLAAEGAEVVVHGRNAERGEKTVQDIENAGGKARFVAADVSDVNDVRRLADEAGAVDILVNNAGIYRFAPTLDTTDEDFDDHFDTNLRAPYVLVQKLVPRDDRTRGRHGGQRDDRRREHSGGGRGHLRRQQGRSRAADQAVGRRVRHAGGAGECGRSGPTQTQGTAAFESDLIEGLGRTTALGRTADVDEIANVVTFVASPAASYVNGAIFTVGGGAQAIRPPA